MGGESSEAALAGARIVTQIYDAALRPAGLAMNQFSLLVATHLLDGGPMARLADELDCDQTTLSRNLGPLLRQGWVAIQPGHDRRTRQVSLTPAGREVLEKALPLWERVQGGAERALRGRVVAGAAGVAAADPDLERTERPSPISMPVHRKDRPPGRKARFERAPSRPLPSVPPMGWAASAGARSIRSPHEPLRRPPTVRRLHEQQASAADQPSTGTASLGADDVGLLSIDQPVAGRRAGAPAAGLSPHPQSVQLRLPHEPRQRAQPRPLGRQCRVSPHGYNAFMDADFWLWVCMPTFSDR